MEWSVLSCLVLRYFGKFLMNYVHFTTVRVQCNSDALVQKLQGMTTELSSTENKYLTIFFECSEDSSVDRGHELKSPGIYLHEKCTISLCMSSTNTIAFAGLCSS